MAGAWRLAESLETLRTQINEAYPNRSKVSDGTIGDASHAATASDHNPNADGVVCAMDITHDPEHGFDAGTFAEYQRTHRHPNLRYVIFNERIAGWWNNWQWTPAQGHTHHVHVSVGTLGVPDGKTYDRYDNTKPWDLGQKEVSMNQSALNVLSMLAWNHPASENFKTKWDGKRPYDVLEAVLNSKENKELRSKAANYGLVVEELTNLKASGGDNALQRLEEIKKIVNRE